MADWASGDWSLNGDWEGLFTGTHVISVDMDFAFSVTSALDLDASEIIGLGVVGPGAGGTVGADQGLGPFGVKVYRPTRKIIRIEKPYE